MKERLPTSNLHTIVKSATESSEDFIRRIHTVTNQVSDRVIAIIGDRTTVIPEDASYETVEELIQKIIPFAERLEESMQGIDFSSQRSILHWIARIQPALQQRKNHTYAIKILTQFRQAGYRPSESVLSEEEKNTFVLGKNIIEKSLHFLEVHHYIHPAVIDWIELWQDRSQYTLLTKATTVLRNLFKNHTI